MKRNRASFTLSDDDDDEEEGEPGSSGREYGSLSSEPMIAGGAPGP